MMSERHVGEVDRRVLPHVHCGCEHERFALFHLGRMSRSSLGIVSCLGVVTEQVSARM